MHDVFISYSSKNKSTADAICALLERDSVRCWIAPRDILPGEAWEAAIVRAIAAARVFVLLYSSASNESAQVRREVSRAASHELPIVPFRIEAVKPNETFEYYISSPHWLDAIDPPLEAHIARLSQAVQALLALASGKEGSTTTIVGDPKAAGQAAAVPSPKQPEHRTLTAANVDSPRATLLERLEKDLRSPNSRLGRSLRSIAWLAPVFAVTTFVLGTWGGMDLGLRVDDALYRCYAFFLPGTDTSHGAIYWQYSIARWTGLGTTVTALLALSLSQLKPKR